MLNIDDLPVGATAASQKSSGLRRALTNMARSRATVTFARLSIAPRSRTPGKRRYRPVTSGAGSTSTR
jgi:hypothetical protein